MIVCGDFFYSTKYWIEQFEVLPYPTRSMGAGVCRHPCGALLCLYNDSLFWGNKDLVWSFFRLGLSMGFSKLEFLGQIASFERSLQGVVSTTLALLCRFRTSTWTRMGAERDKRKVAKLLYFEEVSRAFGCILTSAERDNIQSWHHFQRVVAEVLNFRVLYSRAFVLLDVYIAWTKKTQKNHFFKRHNLQLDKICKLLSQAQKQAKLHRSNSSFNIAFCAVQVFLIFNLLALHVNLV